MPSGARLVCDQQNHSSGEIVDTKPNKMVTSVLSQRCSNMLHCFFSWCSCIFFFVVAVDFVFVFVDVCFVLYFRGQRGGEWRRGLTNVNINL